MIEERDNFKNRLKVLDENEKRRVSGINVELEKLRGVEMSYKSVLNENMMIKVCFW